MESILFVGNSYTYYHDLPQLFCSLACENGHEVRVDSVTKGARRLTEFRNPEDPYTVRLAELLSQRHYAVAFLQEQSVLPISGEATFLVGVEHLCARLKGKAERVILYQTWARRAGHATLVKNGWTVEEMAKRLRDAYRRAADAFDVELSPVGDAFSALLSAHPELELYAEDGTHPSPLGTALAAIVHYRAVFGELPRSMASLGLEKNDETALTDAVKEI